MFHDPFRGGDHILVLCDCYLPDGTPHSTNTRVHCDTVMNQAKDSKPWFGIEQEYTLFSGDGYPGKWEGRRPFGWPKDGYPAEQGPYYCSVGSENIVGREIMNEHYMKCLEAGLTISGTNAEVMLGQWEYQVGPCEGILSGDHVWMSRYIMQRVCEKHGVVVTFDPKPMSGDWNGAGCHTNYSSLRMREDGGIDEIHNAIEKLSKKHTEHMDVYGAGNERRMTGLHETSSMNEFSSGVANRGCSIRIPRQTEKDGKGYFED